MAVTHLTHGKLLTVEQSLLLAALDSEGRDKAVEAIAKHLRRATNAKRGVQWYAVRFKWEMRKR